jgi:TonB family protein
MRRLIAATLALTPFMLHAQASSPAQPQANAPVLQSKLVQPNELNGSGSADRGTTPTAALRISSGVGAPKLLHTVDIVSDNAWPYSITGLDRKVIVGMVVDATGKPEDLKIIQSAGAELDKNVLAAVSQYRFKPGTLNHEPTAVPLNLEIVMRNAAVR